MHKTDNVSDAVAQRALAAVADHPLHAEATSKVYCISDVFEQSKSFIDRARFSEEEREQIRGALQNASTVLLVSYWTSDTKPEPLAGYGKHYAFLIHPKSFAILQAQVGTWRS